MRQERRTIHFSGTVQGVGFRYRTIQAVEGLSITGYVRNLPDGRVRLVLEGDPEQADLALVRIRGLLGRLIRGEECAVETPTGEFSDFSIHR
ncbi:MAG: acylphosphatase [Planctomycetota bacterium]|jgi:acylphosphatase